MGNTSGALPPSDGKVELMDSSIGEGDGEGEGEGESKGADDSE